MIGLTVTFHPFTLDDGMTNDPVLIAYTAKRSKNGKRTHWTRIGRAFPHETGAGLTVLLDAVPLDGRVILLELDAADDRDLITASDMARRIGTPLAPKSGSPREVK